MSIIGSKLMSLAMDWLKEQVDATPSDVDNELYAKMANWLVDRGWLDESYRVPESSGDAAS